MTVHELILVALLGPEGLAAHYERVAALVARNAAFAMGEED